MPFWLLQNMPPSLEIHCITKGENNKRVYFPAHKNVFNFVSMYVQGCENMSPLGKDIYIYIARVDVLIYKLYAYCIYLCMKYKYVYIRFI